MRLRKRTRILLAVSLAVVTIATMTPLNGPGAAAQDGLVERLIAERDSATAWWAMAVRDADGWKAMYFREVAFDTLHQLQASEQLQAVIDAQNRRMRDAAFVAGLTSILMTLIYWISTKISSQ